MKRANLKRKRTSIVPNQRSQLKITNFLELSSSTPSFQEKIEINLAKVSTETIGCQLIRNNLSKLLSDDVAQNTNNKRNQDPDLSFESQRSEQNIGHQSGEESDKCRESNSATNIEKQSVDDNSTDYWRERAKHWEQKANKYKEQFEFTNKLLNRKLREIDMMKKESDAKPEASTDSHRNVLLFRNFEKSFSQDAMYKIRSVRPGIENDRKFVKYCLKGTYEDRNEVILERTLSGRKKQAITPEKLNGIKSIFIERINSEKGDLMSNQIRYESLNRKIANTILELGNEYKAKMKNTAPSDISENLDVCRSHNQNENSVPIIPQKIGIIHDQNIEQDCQNFSICTPVNQAQYCNTSLVLNSAENMLFTFTPNIYSSNQSYTR